MGSTTINLENGPFSSSLNTINSISSQQPSSASILKIAKFRCSNFFRWKHYKYGSSSSSSICGGLYYLRSPPSLHQCCSIKNLLPLVIVVLIICLYWFSCGLIKPTLFWIENQNRWIIFSIFMVSFIVVSFPLAIGYLVLMLSSGYLFGLIRGLVTVIIGANMGAAVAHGVIRNFHKKLPIQQ